MKKYLLQFGSIASCIHFHYLISYVYEFFFTWYQTKQRQNLIFAFYKLTIMTGINVHFLIHKNTKKFTNLWWLNLGTESDLSTVWIFYCDNWFSLLESHWDRNSDLLLNHFQTNNRTALKSISWL